MLHQNVGDFSIELGPESLHSYVKRWHAKNEFCTSRYILYIKGDNNPANFGEIWSNGQEVAVSLKIIMADGAISSFVATLFSMQDMFSALIGKPTYNVPIRLSIHFIRSRVFVLGDRVRKSAVYNTHLLIYFLIFI